MAINWMATEEEKIISRKAIYDNLQRHNVGFNQRTGKDGVIRF